MGAQGSAEPVKSVDTNLLVRVIVKDDPVQTPIAAAAFERPVFVSHGVIMETEWVLRSRYRLPREEICGALKRLLLDVETVKVAERELVAWSLERYAAGADLDDMLHIVASRGSEAFLTFDKGLVDAAGPGSPTPVEGLS